MKREAYRYRARWAEALSEPTDHGTHETPEEAMEAARRLAGEKAAERGAFIEASAFGGFYWVRDAAGAHLGCAFVDIAP